jgi:uncharacterized protein YkwD
MLTVLAALVAAWLSAGAAACSVITPPPPPTPLEVINDVRADHGVAPLVHSDNAAAVAQAWADHLIATQTLQHRPDITAGVTGRWVRVSENVGASWTHGEVLDAYLQSATHRANLLSAELTHVGFGTRCNAQAFCAYVHIFIRYG